MENPTEYGKSTFVTMFILLLGVLLIFSLTSCSQELTPRQTQIEYELEKSYLEYSYERDSLIIEFYKK
jgi:hypothetical protein